MKMHSLKLINWRPVSDPPNYSIINMTKMKPNQKIDCLFTLVLRIVLGEKMSGAQSDRGWTFRFYKKIPQTQKVFFIQRKAEKGREHSTENRTKPRIKNENALRFFVKSVWKLSAQFPWRTASDAAGHLLRPLCPLCRPRVALRGKTKSPIKNWRGQENMSQKRWSDRNS